jgi:hypothetical protein
MFTDPTFKIKKSFAIVTLWLIVCMSFAQAQVSPEEKAKLEPRPLAHHPKLGTMDASGVLKALKQDVSVSDYQKRDVLAMIHSHLSDLFSEETQRELASHLNPAVNQNRQAKAEPAQPVSPPSEHSPGSDGTAAHGG